MQTKNIAVMDKYLILKKLEVLRDDVIGGIISQSQYIAMVALEKKKLALLEDNGEK